MDYVGAFVLGGAICAIFHALMVITKLDPPKLLIIGFTLGALMTVFGVMPSLMQFGGAGLMIMVVDAGEAVVGATMAACAGNFVVTVIVLGIFAAVTLLGIIAGCLWKPKPEVSQAPDEAASSLHS
ncbi:MAG: SpoVA/SpoVAEb family sporulation membrane protein [Gordonibacter sp.]